MSAGSGVSEVGADVSISAGSGSGVGGVTSIVSGSGAVGGDCVGGADLLAQEAQCV